MAFNHNTEVTDEDLRRRGMKPTPPEGRLQCSACGYTAKQSQYLHTCWLGLALCGAVFVLVCSIAIFIAAKLWI